MDEQKQLVEISAQIYGREEQEEALAYSCLIPDERSPATSLCRRVKSDIQQFPYTTKDSEDREHKCFL